MTDIAERESAEYWKKQAKYYEQKAADIQQELDEYTENSAQLERELEASLVQVEKQNRDLETQNQRLKTDLELLKSRLERSQHEANALESEIQSLRADREKQAAYIRELEQKNDDLERGQRVISESVSYIESMLNQAYERNAVLESEVDEVEALRVRLQRATDEARDLKQELKVKDRVGDKLDDGTAAAGNGLAPRPDLHPPSPKREVNGNSMTPSSRVSAINIVGDLLRKVGLERFLCTECGKVRCTCHSEPASPADAAVQSTDPRVSCVNVKTYDKQEPPVEYRRHFNSPDRSNESNGSDSRHDPNVFKRNSDQPFVRGDVGAGKLRRSFAVRSREGLGNIFGLSSRRDVEKKNANS